MKAETVQGKRIGKVIICLILHLVTLFVPVEIHIKFDTVKSGWSIVLYIEGSHLFIYKNIIGSTQKNHFIEAVILSIHNIHLGLIIENSYFEYPQHTFRLSNRKIVILSIHNIHLG